LEKNIKFRPQNSKGLALVFFKKKSIRDKTGQKSFLDREDLVLPRLDVKGMYTNV
jgi:hypothetical protein